MIYKAIAFALVLGLASAYPRNSLASSVKDELRKRKSNGLGIFGGKNATIEEYPYLVGIIGSEEFLEAGAILNERWVITVALWLEGYNASQLTVVAGSSDGFTGNTYKVKKLIIHPNYSTDTLDYDYALIKVNKAFAWSSTIGNVSLPSHGPKPRTPLALAGWGNTGDSEKKTALQQGTMYSVKWSKCKEIYYTLNFTARWTCAFNKGKTTICFGDFGDPFVKDGVLYGLAKDGYVDEWCTSEYPYPIALSNIYAAVDWITGIISL